MNCEQIRDLIALGAGGEASDHERIAIESHVAVCVECARELAEARALVANLAILREGDAPAGTAERIWARVESAIPGRRRSPVLAWSLRVAAVLILGVSVGYSTTSIVRHSDRGVLPIEEDVVDDARATYVPRTSELSSGGTDRGPHGLSLAPLPEGTVLPAGTGYYLPKVDQVLDTDEVRF